MLKYPGKTAFCKSFHRQQPRLRFGHCGGPVVMYHGFYINLDRNELRRKALASHLDEIGAAARYQRIEAVDGRAVAQQYQTTLEPGVLGCWLSHLKTLEANCGAQTHLHIIEDDTIFARNAVGMFDALLDFADANLSGWDLIFTDICIDPADCLTCLEFLRATKGCQQAQTRLRLLDLQHSAFAATSSYFVNWRSIDKYKKLVSVPGTEGLPIDLYIRRLARQKELRAYLTMPFLTSISSEGLQSDISQARDPTRDLFLLVRRAFFQDADLASLNAQIDQLIRGITVSPLERLYLQALVFVLSDRYVIF